MYIHIFIYIYVYIIWDGSDVPDVVSEERLIHDIFISSWNSTHRPLPPPQCSVIRLPSSRVPPQYCDPRPLGSCPDWLNRETRFNEKKMLHERVPKELIPSNIPRGVNGGLKKRGGVREDVMVCVCEGGGGGGGLSAITARSRWCIHIHTNTHTSTQTHTHTQCSHTMKIHVERIGRT